MNLKTYKALGRVFSAEIENRLPYQSRSKVFKQLERDGLVNFGKEVRPTRFGDLTIEGWWLTHAGRLAFCMESDNRFGDVS